MARTSISTVQKDYVKEEVIAALKDAKSRIEDAILTHEEALEKWRQEIPAKFADWVENFPKEKVYYRVNLDQFSPPQLSNVCQDYRVQELNRCIARIGLMAGDVIKLRQDDPCFTYIGIGECL